MNLTETADSAPKFGLEEMGEAHFAREELGAQQTGISYQVLKPGKRQAFGHNHDKAEEIYVVLSGSGRDDWMTRSSTSRPSMRFALSRALERAFEAGPEGMEWLAVGAHHDKDGEVIQEFWTD